jgi:hypothetical protein
MPPPSIITITSRVRCEKGLARYTSYVFTDDPVLGLRGPGSMTNTIRSVHGMPRPETRRHLLGIVSGRIELRDPVQQDESSSTMYSIHIDSIDPYRFNRRFAALRCTLSPMPNQDGIIKELQQERTHIDQAIQALTSPNGSTRNFP